MRKHYEVALPDDYEEVYIMEPTKHKKLKVVSIIIMLVMVGIVFVCFNFKNLIDSVKIMKTKELIMGYVGYFGLLFGSIVVHELIHGIIYKIYTKQKLVYGYKNKCAYCGVLNIYVYRHAALMSLMGPFVLLSLMFGLLTLLVQPLLFKFLCLILLIVNEQGCIFDLYDIYLLLFKYKDESTLIYDNGPVQTFYQKRK